MLWGEPEMPGFARHDIARLRQGAELNGKRPAGQPGAFALRGQCLYGKGIGTASIRVGIAIFWPTKMKPRVLMAGLALMIVSVVTT